MTQAEKDKLHIKKQNRRYRKLIFRILAPILFLQLLCSPLYIYILCSEMRFPLSRWRSCTRIAGG